MCPCHGKTREPAFSYMDSFPYLAADEAVIYEVVPRLSVRKHNFANRLVDHGKACGSPHRAHEVGSFLQRAPVGTAGKGGYPLRQAVVASPSEVDQRKRLGGQGGSCLRVASETSDRHNMVGYGPMMKYIPQAQTAP
ncbi:hypothetical protein MLD38_003369 [Melastoma candidum]|uniref:Uncharacterized protein n=1 Tax=Melastoma candidum TaxID=119954 RepID=A0ACB9S2L5_9MYRT|nr:hypothetical protein MLD38_003369 [Melastoma candidum]